MSENYNVFLKGKVKSCELNIKTGWLQSHMWKIYLEIHGCLSDFIILGSMNKEYA